MKLLKCLPLFFLCCLPLSYAADINVQHDNVPQFCATGQQPIAGGVNYTGTCVVPPPPVGPCAGPSGYMRLTRTSVSYGATGQSYSSRDLTQWTGLYGFANSGGVVPAAWPGVNGSGPVVRNLGKRQFLGLQFNTGAAPNTRNGFLIYNSNIGGPNLEAKISTSCGDFTPEVSGCYKANAYSDDSRFLSWKVNSTNTSFCRLLPNTTYYLNLRYVPGNNRICAGASCPFFTTSQWGG